MGNSIKLIGLYCRKIRRYIKYKKFNYRVKNTKKLKVNLIYYESGWILYKFAKSVYDELKKMGVDVSLSKQYNSTATINHYFVPNYADIVNRKTTFMITHVDTEKKVEQIREQVKKGATGICMSDDTRMKLISYGISPTHLCYINPAQDKMIIPRKSRIGFFMDDIASTQSVYFSEILSELNPAAFEISLLTNKELINNKIDEFHSYEIDCKSSCSQNDVCSFFLNTDVFCCLDENCLWAFVDAIGSGKEVIAFKCPEYEEIDNSKVRFVNSVHEIITILRAKEYEYLRRLDYIKTYTWENYVLKHMEIWNYISRNKELKEILSTRGWYNDGIYSLLLEDMNTVESFRDRIKKNISKRG